MKSLSGTAPVPAAYRKTHDKSTPDTSAKRLAEKMAETRPASAGNPTVGWDHSRIVTPGGICGYQSSKGVQFVSFDDSTKIQLLHAGEDSQGLLSEKGRVTAASVSTSVHTKVQRKQEKKGTFVQYDKNRVKQEGADFTIDPRNYRGWVNYQGGHLVDHKYSAGNSHYLEHNYIPIHFFYNAPLKEYLVQRCDAYVEIPLYTPNPPMIGVKGQKDKYHPVPVGIIFVQLKENKIDNVYYFPNNNFDYKGLRDKLQLKDGFAEAMVPLFRLHRSFHLLLRPAIIFDIARLKDGFENQGGQEETFFDLVDDMTFGMSLAECADNQSRISQLCFSVLHKGRVDASLCLGCSERQFSLLKGQPLAPSFNALGEFFVRHGIGNALKAEVVSVKSRLVFLNVIIDFIEGHTQVSDSALEFMDAFAHQFQTALAELDKIARTMDRKELLYLANTYQRLASEGNHAFSSEDYDLYDFDDIEVYFRRLIHVLRIIESKHDLESFQGDSAWNVISFVSDAQDSLDYMIETGWPKKLFTEEKQFLKKMSSISSALLDQNASSDKGVNATFQTNINRATSMRTAPGYLQAKLARAGSPQDDDSSVGSDNEDISSGEE